MCSETIRLQHGEERDKIEVFDGKLSLGVRLGPPWGRCLGVNAAAGAKYSWLKREKGSMGFQGVWHRSGAQSSCPAAALGGALHLLVCVPPFSKHGSNHVFPLLFRSLHWLVLALRTEGKSLDPGGQCGWGLTSSGLSASACPGLRAPPCLSG